MVKKGAKIIDGQVIKCHYNCSDYTNIVCCRLATTAFDANCHTNAMKLIVNCEPQSAAMNVEVRT